MPVPKLTSTTPGDAPELLSPTSGVVTTTPGTVPKSLVVFPYTRMFDAHEGVLVLTVMPPVLALKAVTTVSVA